jgi:hypothetical protein
MPDNLISNLPEMKLADTKAERVAERIYRECFPRYAGHQGLRAVMARIIRDEYGLEKGEFDYIPEEATGELLEPKGDRKP